MSHKDGRAGRSAKRIGSIIYLVLARDVFRECCVSSVKKFGGDFRHLAISLVAILATLIVDIFALDQ